MAKSTKADKSKSAKPGKTDETTLEPSETVEPVTPEETSQSVTETAPDDAADAAGDTPAVPDPATDDSTATKDASDTADADTPVDDDLAEPKPKITSPFEKPTDPVADKPETEDEAPKPQDPPTPAPQPQPEQVVVKRGGFFPMLLGGVVAAGIGVASAEYIFPNGLPFGPQATQRIDLQSEIALQSGRIDGVESQISDIPRIDPAALEAANTAIEDLQAQASALTSSLTALEKRVKGLENRPTGQSDVAAGDIANVEAQLAEMRATLDAQKGEIASMIEDAQNAKQDAEETARNTMARAAITRILVALDSGASFEEALTDIEVNSDVAVPEVLAQTAASGVPTLAALGEQYPDAARAALAAARSDEPSGGLGSFLTKQLGARSVVPREGNDPDAILSRMEAAVNDGRVADALADMEALPDAAKAPLADWAEQANLRLTAAREAEALANSLNSQ